MNKPTVYLDTSVISAFWYEGADVGMLVRQMRTREWWDLERPNFVVWGSSVVEKELAAGTFRRQRECLKMMRRLRHLPVTSAIRQLAEEIVDVGLIPVNKSGDAAHLAISSSHGIDYLLTWNYAHMANPAVQTRFNQLCEKRQLAAPLMVSPESIPQVRFGQSIWRSR